MPQILKGVLTLQKGMQGLAIQRTIIPNYHSVKERLTDSGKAEGNRAVAKDTSIKERESTRNTFNYFALITLGIFKLDTLKNLGNKTWNSVTIFFFY